MFFLFFFFVRRFNHSSFALLMSLNVGFLVLKCLLITQPAVTGTHPDDKNVWCLWRIGNKPLPNFPKPRPKKKAPLWSQQYRTGKKKQKKQASPCVQKKHRHKHHHQPWTNELRMCRVDRASSFNLSQSRLPKKINNKKQKQPPMWLSDAVLAHALCYYPSPCITHDVGLVHFTSRDQRLWFSAETMSSSRYNPQAAARLL